MFSYIEHFIRNLFESNREEVPSITMIDLENKWDSFSTGIQKSIDGAISPPIIVTNRYGNPSVLDHVFGSRIALNIGILYFVCNNHNPPLYYGNRKLWHRSQPTRRRNVEADICVIAQEPTIRIVGRNGLCAQVSDDGGNAIVLWPCNSNIEDLSQLWTPKADGTIRSNGDILCLTAYGYDPGNYIMIYDCKTAVPDATKWEIWDNGTIFNPRSSLVLGANSPTINTTLVMMENVYSTGQAWVISNNTEPFVTPIMNEDLSNMCLQAFDDTTNNLGFSGCSSVERRQLFALYPDSSIRPNDKRDECLTAYIRDNIVIIAKCYDIAEQRWLFNTDYTISNLHTHLVMVPVDDSIYLIPSSVPLHSRQWRVHFL